MSEAQDQHEMLCRLKDLAIELGRTPTRDEFVVFARIAKDWPNKYFGTFAAMIQAAGLDGEGSGRKRRPKITNAVFETSIDRHLESYRSEEPQASEKPDWPHLAAISDIHWPFHSQKVIDRFLRYISDEKPEYALLVGDAWDMYSHGKFPRSHNVFTPKEEEAQARRLNQEFWEQVRRASPETKCVQMLGNHDVRPLKRTIEAMPTMEHWIEEVFKRLFSFEGVETIFDPRQELMLPMNIMVHHGYRSKLGDHRDFALHSAIVGHTHRPGVVWRKIRGSQLFELNCGLAGDPLAKGLTYTPQKIVDWVNAFGVVDEDGPRNVVV